MPLEVSKEWEAPVKMRQRTMTFSRFSIGDSAMPSSCELKDEPEFKPLQGNCAFFSVRASQGPFHLRQKTQGPSNIPTAEENSTSGACGKLAHLFSQRQGISSHLGMIWGAWSFPQVAVLKLIFI